MMKVGELPKDLLVVDMQVVAGSDAFAADS